MTHDKLVKISTVFTRLLDAHSISVYKLTTSTPLYLSLSLFLVLPKKKLSIYYVLQSKKSSGH